MCGCWPAAWCSGRRAGSRPGPGAPGGRAGGGRGCWRRARCGARLLSKIGAGYSARRRRVSPSPGTVFLPPHLSPALGWPLPVVRTAPRHICPAWAMIPSMWGGLARRILFAPVVLVAVAVVMYGSLRILRPDLFPPSDSLVGGIVHDLDRGLLHLDLGCAPPGGTGSGARPSGKCLPVRVLWQRGMAADIWLLVGSIIIGGVTGVLGGLWCAGHPRARSSRALQAGAALAYCAPVYVVGLGLLLLFSPEVGLVHVPFFFDAVAHWASPLSDPWTWLRTLLVPWLVLAAPLAGMCLRLTLG